jgi:hypothetical protein
MRDSHSAERFPSRAAPALKVTGVLFASVAMSLILSEVALRTLFDPVRVLDGDAMWEYRWRAAHVGDEGRADSVGVYGFDVYDSKLGWKPRPGYKTQRVRTNSLGIRADREFEIERVPGISRIVIIGDSFMWGEGVANEETFASRLENNLSGTEVINLGVHGYGTDQQRLRLHELGFRFEPDVVILGFYEENLWRNALSFRDYAKPRYRLAEGGLVLGNHPVPAPGDILADQQRLPRSFLLVLVRRVLRRAKWQWGLGIEDSEEWQITRKILAVTNDEIETRGGRLLLLYVPTSDLSVPGRAEGLLEVWARESGVSFVNLRKRFLELPEPRRMRLYDGHWTVFGNGVTADIVTNFLSAENLLNGTSRRPR